MATDHEVYEKISTIENIIASYKERGDPYKLEEFYKLIKGQRDKLIRRIE